MKGMPRNLVSPETRTRLSKGRAPSGGRSGRGWQLRREELMTIVCHEVRAPINAILETLECILETPLSHGQLHSLEKIRSAAGDVLGMLNDLGDFAKLEAGKLELQSTNFFCAPPWTNGCDSRALVARIRARGELAAARVVLMTSGDIVRYRNLEVDGHISKPVVQRELFEAIDSAVSPIARGRE